MAKALSSDKITLLLRGELGPEEEAALRAEIDASPELRREYERAAKLQRAAGALAERDFPLPRDLSARVLEDIAAGKGRASLMSRLLQGFGAAAVVAAACVVLMLVLPHQLPPQSGAGGGGFRGGGFGGGGGHTILYNDVRLGSSVNALLTYAEGAFGALIMVLAALGGLGAVVLRRWRLAAFLLGLAVLSYLLRSALGTFFNDDNLQSSLLPLLLHAAARFA